MIFIIILPTGDHSLKEELLLGILKCSQLFFLVLISLHGVHREIAAQRMVLTRFYTENKKESRDRVPS